MSTAKRLSVMTFVTNLGDYASQFACIALVYQNSQSVLGSSSIIPASSAGVLAAGLLLPRIASLFSFRSILVWSQLASGALVLLIGFSGNRLSSIAIVGLYFVVSFLKNIFDVARDSYAAPKAESHRSTWATVYFGRYGAQVIGPILALFLVKTAPLWIAFVFDSLTFLGCAWIAASLAVKAPGKYRFRAALTRIRSNQSQRMLYLSRGILCWIPIGLSNFLSVKIMKDHLGGAVEDTAWIYAVSGAGAALAAFLLKDQEASKIPVIQKYRAYLKRIPDWRLAMISLVFMGIARPLYFYSTRPALALSFLAVGSLFMALHALSSQSIRSQIARGDEFMEFTSLETTTAKATEIGVATLAGWVMGVQGISLEAVLLVAVIGYIVAGLSYLGLREAKPVPEVIHG